EREDRRNAVVEQDERLSRLREELRAREDAFVRASAAQREAERELARRDERIAALTAEAQQAAIRLEERRIEAVAFRTQLDALRAEVEGWQRDEGARGAAAAALSRRADDAEAAREADQKMISDLSKRLEELGGALTAP